MAWWSWPLRLLCGAAGFAGVAVALLYFFQEKLLYVPHVPGMPEWHESLVPEKWGFEAEDVWLTAADGTKLHAWMLLPRGWNAERSASRPLLVFFQENAGNMSHRLPFLRLLARHLQVPIFAPSYRGYGHSKGRPSEKGILQDAAAVMAHLEGRPDVDAARIVLFGRSLGGAVALHLAARNQSKVKGVIVENAFSSVEDMAGEILPPLGAVIGEGKPLNWLVTNKWRNVDEVAKLEGMPLLLLASLKDEMVPVMQMRRLRAAVPPGNPVTWVEFPNAHHMDAYDTAADAYWPALVQFLQQHVEQ